jgi:ribonuclease G
LFEEIKTYIQTIAPDKEKIVKLYRGELPIFETFGIEKQIKGLFGKMVNMRSGAYLVIEHTEALHVIDVNSGNRAKSESTQEVNAFEVNLEAASEIARQLRLRDMGGIIVVDFIDLHDPNNRKLLFQKMKDEMAHDKAKHTILPPSKFGLIQITRQRVRPEMEINTQEVCPACNGTGEVQASIRLVDEIERNLRYIIQEQHEKGITLNVHPYLEAYLTKGIISRKMKWAIKYKTRIEVKAVAAYHMLEYHFLNKDQEEIKL